ncbi:MAG TPA: DUF1344 domain-containing protein, partial [Afifellaceae bacterium]|nr:DUF1344 domain-containing protein [Afifellaceae bacterium]
AFAADMATGTVKSFDLTTHGLTLDNGTVYTLPANFRDPGLMVGEKVNISWEMKNGKHMADGVTIQKSRPSLWRG